MLPGRPVVSWQCGKAVAITAGTSWLAVSDNGQTIYRTRDLGGLRLNLTELWGKPACGPFWVMTNEIACLDSDAGRAAMTRGVLRDVQAWLEYVEYGEFRYRADREGADDRDIRVGTAGDGDVYIGSHRAFGELTLVLPNDVADRVARLCLRIAEFSVPDLHPKPHDWYRRHGPCAFGVSHGRYLVQLDYDGEHQTRLRIRSPDGTLAGWTFGRSYLPVLAGSLNAASRG